MIKPCWVPDSPPCLDDWITASSFFMQKNVACQATNKKSKVDILESIQQRRIINMKKDLTELVFILDRSGSMSGLESDTIGGYNALLKKQQEQPGEAIVTTVLFDDEYEIGRAHV